MITQPGDLLKSVAVIYIDLVDIVFLAWVGGCEHVTAMGKFELDDTAQDDLAVVADCGLEDVVETEFVAAADCHVVA